MGGGCALVLQTVFSPLMHAFQETMKCQNTGNLLIGNKIDGGLLKPIAPFVSRVEN